MKAAIVPMFVASSSSPESAMNADSQPVQLQCVKYVLWVREMGRAVAFYRDLFGMSVAVDSPDWSELKQGDAIVALHAGGDGVRTVTGLSFQVANASAACRRAEELGGRIVSPPSQSEGDPVLVARIADPEGNEVMVTEFVAK